MRFFVFAFAVLAVASAASIASDYLPPVVDNSLLTQEFILPETSEVPAPLTDDGYRYKVVRKLKLRHRRDVNELPTSEYLPPIAAATYENVDAAPIAEQSIVVEAPAVAAEKTVLADDGYRYKTVRRLRYRHRRDVNELPASEYLPPVAEGKEEVIVATAPIAEETIVFEAPAQAAEETTVLADDGYRYKTVRRLRYRHRRDVNELPSSEYLPPVAESRPEVVVEAVPEEKAVVEEAPAAIESAAEEKTVLADDGYRYKTVRRIRYRYRRDVNELPSSEYLPPVAETKQEIIAEAIPAAEEIVVVQTPSASEEKTVLADDGYRYKTVRRLRYRHRRDVNELPSSEYLPPVAEAKGEVVVDAAPAVVDIPFVVEQKTVLADDGYRYKTVRRIRYRHRRDVNELPSSEYLPPVAEAKEEVVVDAAPAVVDIPTVGEQKTVLANDGYRYKTVRRIRYRHRRDVNELPSSEYLPPVAEAKQQEVLEEAVPAAEEAIVVETPAAAEETTVLANDGYRYKTVRRLRYRYRRDVNELPTSEYLPPAEAQTEEIASVVSVPEEQTVLGDDGYRYKTVRRLKYRQRRDVSELLPSSEYLPPTLESGADLVVATQNPEETVVLLDDGYRYKAVRKLKYRRH